ncbi:MAG: 3-oxoacyl-[acyl-carrier-protein] synthase [Solirubrobacteraceae bacterium]|jgi:3-oxoacyl-[acyl-carrier-protein] synthase II|nr:3-oxoacyl-[acyl-carrier-protein] synthase [Solirubrobacteraceae bacterium]
MSAEVLVTGRGVVTSIGEGAEDFVDALMARRSGIEDGVGRAEDFDPESTMTPKEARRADRFTQFALAAADQAMAEAGLGAAGDGVDAERVAVVIGTGVGGLETVERGVRDFAERGERGLSPLTIPMMMPNAAAAHIAMRFGAHGPGFSLASACATGAHAIGEAARMIARGEADVVIAGGSEAAMTEVGLAAFRRMGALSRQGVSCPFDARRDGFVMGEGAGVVVLEAGEHARARGAPALARVAGYAASNDAFHITAPDEDGRGATAVMRGAIEDAGATPADVGYLNAHGTSTPFNDRIEALAAHTVFGGEPPPISSTKSAIGHLLGAAGAVEAVATIGALQRGLLPPTLNYEEPDPECDVDCVPDGPREAPGLELALSNSFGFGGQNACLALARA